MAGQSASLLTKTQRTRIKDDFDGLDQEKKRRDQQRIRERFRSGLLDFQLLADYPDRQFEMAFDDLSDDELRTTLASTTIVVERLCELNGIDRDELIKEIRGQTEDYTDTTTAPTLEQIDLQTAAEIRRQTKAEVEEQFEENQWDKRASRLGKLAVAFFLPFPLFAYYDAYVADINMEIFNYLEALLGSAFVLCILGWFLITSLQTLKYDIVPVFVKFRREPRTFVKRRVRNLIKNPGQRIRQMWEEL
ncbi:hypothetical protein HZS55_21285 [Halosimplex rubrum]|uniref:Uncharacterized protein n=1 Tax=Halosimplex rubrum TaxID=869889 RepID=A0A7D5TPE4_9EURY|nr:hypothetical protein [Halosimplex rubrum]QLH79672.1 hypothetical protein HZS55_21285 [Halosimplex rubrum]